MNQIRVGYFADGPWSHGAIKLLAADPSISIEFVVPRAKHPDQTIIDFAREHRITCYTEAKINSSAFRDFAAEKNCDLFISMSFDQIFKRDLFSLPRLGTINCHAGKLPFYRGRNVLNWVLINDEREFGITVHYVDEGIDTGDIILQEVIPITDKDNYKSLLATAYRICPTILYNAIKLVQAGNGNRVEQASIDRVGSYCRKRGIGDETINWNQTTRKLFNFIRAISDPGPKAQTLLDGHVIKINGANMTDLPVFMRGIPGEIVEKTTRGWLVCTTDSVIEITDVDSVAELKQGYILGS